MSEHRRAFIGSQKNFWLFSSVHGYDLTHPDHPEAPLIHPRVIIETNSACVTIDPAKTALVIIDMQNFFLSPNLKRRKEQKGIEAGDKLLQHAIPACRKAGIQIVWLNWGLTQEEIDTMPPATLKAFGFSTVPADEKLGFGDGDSKVDSNDVGDRQSKATVLESPSGRDPQLYRGLGSELGPIELDDGSVVEGGRMLMRDQWNTALYAPLEEARQEGLKAGSKRQDVCIHKNRMSGLWGAETECTKYLASCGIRTLLFAGVNTDQCVGGSLQDAYTKGFDCILLSDGSATTSPNYAQQCVEFNSEKVWGFVTSCENLAKGVDNIEIS